MKVFELMAILCKCKAGDDVSAHDGDGGFFEIGSAEIENAGDMECEFLNLKLARDKSRD